MVRSDYPILVTDFPWIEPSDLRSAVDPSSISRGYLVLPSTVSLVYCDESKDPLPEVARWADFNKRLWKKYELPRGEANRSYSRVNFSNGQSLETMTSEVPIGPGISRSVLDELLEDDSEIHESLSMFALMRDQIETHIEFVNDLCDQIKSKLHYWEGNCDGLAIRSMHRVATRLRRTGNRDSARLSLIVKLAREISRDLGNVCANPRVVLRRTREFQKISSIQEIDSSCLRWLARQPGRDVYERAGSRQQLLGVVRKEDTDTLENRMVKDLLHRARVECSNYLSIHREFSNHDRVRAVAKFRTQIFDWEKHSEIKSAKRLTGPIQPNYVLLHELKYRKLWDAYQQLLSQQKQKDDIWKWRDRTFTECCELGLLCMLHNYVRRSSFAKSDIALQIESIAGKYVSSDTQLGIAKLLRPRNSALLGFCRAPDIYQSPFIQREFYPLGADFFLASENSQRINLIPVWCMIQPNPSTMQDGISILESKLNSIPMAELIKPLVLVFESHWAQRPFFHDRGLIASVDYPILKSIPRIEPFIANALEIA